MKQVNNKIKLIGEIITPIEFSHESFGERFLKFDIQTFRLSQQKDIIPIVVPERRIEENIVIGDMVEIDGQFRSFSEFDNEGKNHLILFGFVKKIKKSDSPCSLNEIVLKGFFCNKPIYRETPFGRQIVDILVAVNRDHNKSDYIPCIAWGRNAQKLKDLPVGTEIELQGRIQSREYLKVIENGEKIPKTAMEVSISQLNII